MMARLNLLEMLQAVLATIPLYFAHSGVQILWNIHAHHVWRAAFNDDGYRTVAVNWTTWHDMLSQLHWQEVPVMFIVVGLDYMLQHWQDRLLPTRGVRQSQKDVDQQSYEKVTDNDPQIEEKIVKRLIAQGKIKRASVNWSNVLRKWLFHATITSELKDIIWLNGMDWLPGGRRPFNWSTRYSPLGFVIIFLVRLLSPNVWFLLLSTVLVPLRYRLQCVETLRLALEMVIAFVVYFNLALFTQTDLGMALALNYIRMSEAGSSNSTATVLGVPVSHGTEL